MQVTVTIRNTGDKDGLEIAQVYFRDVVSSLMTPVKQLIAFQRVAIPAGEKRTITLQLAQDAFSLVHPDETRWTEPGEFELMCGHSSKDADLLRMTFTLD